MKPASDGGAAPTERSVHEVLSRVIDPELGIDVVALGLVRDVRIGRTTIHVTMTLTTAGCPLGDAITRDARIRLERHAPDRWIDVALVWDPPWSPEQMTERARYALGLAGS